MPLYATTRLTSLDTGFPSLTMFDGTESPAGGVTSQAFTPNPGPFGVLGIVFTIDWGSVPNAEVDIQAANQNVEADFQSIKQWTANNQHDNYADIGNYKFYRAKLITYVSGGMPVVIARRK